jgi:hypothetical protein
MSLILLGMGMVLLAGCARQDVTAIKPTEDELPNIPERGRVLPVSVKVEGQEQPLLVTLVPKFEEPELTAEERAAMGEQPQTIDWLEFYRPQPAVQRIAADLGGVSAGVSGMGGPELGFDHYDPVVRIGLSRGDIQGVHHDLDVRYRAYAGATSVTGIGGLAGVEVRVNPVRRVAIHETRSEP